jgi:hypothetical protein
VPEGKSPGDQLHITIADKRLQHQRLCVHQSVSGTQHLEGQGHRDWVMAVPRHHLKHNGRSVAAVPAAR